MKDKNVCMMLKMAVKNKVRSRVDACDVRLIPSVEIKDPAATSRKNGKRYQRIMKLSSEVTNTLKIIPNERDRPKGTMVLLRPLDNLLKSSNPNHRPISVGANDKSFIAGPIGTHSPTKFKIAQ